MTRRPAEMGFARLCLAACTFPHCVRDFQSHALSRAAVFNVPRAFLCPADILDRKLRRATSRHEKLLRKELKGVVQQDRSFPARPSTPPTRLPSHRRQHKAPMWPAESSPPSAGIWRNPHRRSCTRTVPTTGKPLPLLQGPPPIWVYLHVWGLCYCICVLCTTCVRRPRSVQQTTNTVSVERGPQKMAVDPETEGDGVRLGTACHGGGSDRPHSQRAWMHVLSLSGGLASTGWLLLSVPPF